MEKIFVLLNIKSHYKALIIKELWYWHQYWQTIKPGNRPAYRWELTLYDTGATINQLEQQKKDHWIGSAGWQGTIEKDEIRCYLMAHTNKFKGDSSPEGESQHWKYLE